MPDAPIVAPMMITISGTAEEQGQSGSTPLAGAAIGIYKQSDDATALGTTMTDASGNYSVTLMTNGVAIDGYVKATKMNYVDAYAYPAVPFSKDTTVSVNTLTTSTYNLLVVFGGGSAGHGLITLVVTDASDKSVMGAKVSSMPASSYKYSDAQGHPSSAVMETAADGLAFMFDVPPGNVTVSATKSGMTFGSHTLNARADKFTTTVVRAQ